MKEAGAVDDQAQVGGDGDGLVEDELDTARAQVIGHRLLDRAFGDIRKAIVYPQVKRDTVTASFLHADLRFV
jgi:hypothetical protein